MPFVILAVSAAEATATIARRRQRGGGDARRRPSIQLDAQLAPTEPLDADEQPFVVRWDAGGSQDIAAGAYPTRCSAAAMPGECAVRPMEPCHDGQTDSHKPIHPAPLPPDYLRRRHREDTRCSRHRWMDATSIDSIARRVTASRQRRWTDRARWRCSRLTHAARSGMRERSQAHAKTFVTNGAGPRHPRHRDMPVWGPTFRSPGALGSTGHARIANVISYVGRSGEIGSATERAT